jgi:mRNA-degrading endonuclease RelE of RelBE toxin-antitoxin system
VSPYRIYFTPRALAELPDLPGHVRQRARRAIDDLAADPRPSRNVRLAVDPSVAELRRLRLDRWRIV